jgi:hypothetical protein
MDAAGYLTQNDTVVNGNIIAFGLRSGNLKVDSVAAHIEERPIHYFLPPTWLPAI